MDVIILKGGHHNVSYKLHLSCFYKYPKEFTVFRTLYKLFQIHYGTIVDVRSFSGLQIGQP